MNIFFDEHLLHMCVNNTDLQYHSQFWNQKCQPKWNEAIYEYYKLKETEK